MRIPPRQSSDCQVSEHKEQLEQTQYQASTQDHAKKRQQREPGDSNLLYSKVRRRVAARAQMCEHGNFLMQIYHTLLQCNARLMLTLQCVWMSRYVRGYILLSLKAIDGVIFPLLQPILERHKV